MNTIDLIVILLIVGFIIVGGMRGLINSAIGLFGYLLSIFLAYKLSGVFAKFMIEKWQIDEKINSVILSQIPRLAENLVNNNDKYKGMVELGGGIDSVKETLANTKLPFIDVIAQRIVQVLAIIILFIAFKLLFQILAKLLNGLAKLPVIKEVNKIGGMIIGAIEGVIVSVLILAVVCIIPNDDLQEKVSNSFIGNKVSQAIMNVSVTDLAGVETSDS